MLTYRTGIQDANLAGNVHGGWVMKLCDDVAVIAATRLAGGRVVTAAVDAMKFRAPVQGRRCDHAASDRQRRLADVDGGRRARRGRARPTGEVTHTCTAYVTLVALGEDEKPVCCPPSSRRHPKTSDAIATPTTAASSGSPPRAQHPETLAGRPEGAWMVALPRRGGSRGSTRYKHQRNRKASSPPARDSPSKARPVRIPSALASVCCKARFRALGRCGYTWAQRGAFGRFSPMSHALQTASPNRTTYLRS